MQVVKEYIFQVDVPGIGSSDLIWRCLIDRLAYVTSSEFIGETSAVSALRVESSFDYAPKSVQWSEALAEQILTWPVGTKLTRRWSCQTSRGAGEIEVSYSARIEDWRENRPYVLNGDIELAIGKRTFSVKNVESPDSALMAIAVKFGIEIHVCATCVWSDYCIFGGVDEWEGHCCFVQSRQLDRLERWSTEDVETDADWDAYPQLADKAPLSPLDCCLKWSRREPNDAEATAYREYKSIEVTGSE